MRSSFLFTSESVSEGHPDKVADQISDTVVDLFLSQDPEARIACETLTTTQLVVLAGEIRGKGVYENGQWAPGVEAEIEAAVRATVKRIGYEQSGFHWNEFTFLNKLHGQSAEIAMGVDEAGNKDEGAGDQGIMFGYATDETPGLMPATLYYSHKILERMAADRHSGAAPFLEPDAKSQVTLQYENEMPVRATALVVSTQHKAGYSEKGDNADAGKYAELRDYVTGVMNDVLPEGYITADTAIYINPTGAVRDRRARRRRRADRPQDHRRHLRRRRAARRWRVQRQGPDEGRPLGRLCRALPRQERRRSRARPPLHHPALLCDRRRRAAVASMSTPTGPALSQKPSWRRSCPKLVRLTPKGIRQHLSLNKPIYSKTAAYGHFGRDAEGDLFTWERTDLVDRLKEAVAI